MPIHRRTLLGRAPALLIPLLGVGLGTGPIRPAFAQRADARMDQRALGSPDAKVVVQEWFSLTCTHCAHFALTVFPEVKAKLIDTGKVFFVFHDFPLDQLALAAAAVARSLPPDRYLPFIDSLFASQDRWAFGADPATELGHQAALAGMAGPEYQALSHDPLRDAIMAEQDDGQKRYDIQGTPTFIFGNDKAGLIETYADFAAATEKALAKPG
ncbi:MAG: thioredoxin domain-containing protein [Janthinobacterium lividum]